MMGFINKIIVISLICAMISVIIALLPKQQSWKVYDNEHVNDSIIINGNLKTTFVDEILLAIDILPHEVIDEFYSHGWKLYIINGNSMDKLGYADLKNKYILIYQSGVSEYENYSVTETVLHEFGHFVDYMYYIYGDKQFKNICNYEENDFLKLIEVQAYTIQQHDRNTLLVHLRNIYYIQTILKKIVN